MVNSKVNSKMKKKKETSSNRKKNKDNKQASVLSKLDHGPSGGWGTVPRYEVFSFLNSLTPFMSVMYSNLASISCFVSLTVFVKNVGKTKWLRKST